MPRHGRDEDAAGTTAPRRHRAAAGKGSLWRDAQLPDAVERAGAQPVRRADHRAGDPGAGRADAERDRVGGRRAQRGAGRRLPRRRAARRRVDRPHAQAPRHDLGRRGPSRRARRTPRARPVRRARDLAHDRRRARSWASRPCSSTCRTRASSRRSCAPTRSPRRTASCSRPSSSRASPARRSAGWLVGVLAAPLAIFITVGTYVASFIALLFTRDHEKLRAPEDHKPLRARDRRGPAVGVRQSAAAPHRRHDRRRELLRHDRP